MKKTWNLLFDVLCWEGFNLFLKLLLHPLASYGIVSNIPMFM